MCEVCGFELWLPTRKYPNSTLGLYNDARFPGRSILKLNEHHTEFESLPQKLLHSYMEEVQQAVQLLKEVTGSERVNISFLGNTVPHVHAHLIPRYPDIEQFPGKSPWNDPRKLATLNGIELSKLLDKFATK